MGMSNANMIWLESNYIFTKIILTLVKVIEKN